MALIKTSKKWIYAIVSAAVAAAVVVLGIYNLPEVATAVNDAGTKLVEFVPEASAQ